MFIIAELTVQTKIAPPPLAFSLPDLVYSFDTESIGGAGEQSSKFYTFMLLSRRTCFAS